MFAEVRIAGHPQGNAVCRKILSHPCFDLVGQAGIVILDDDLALAVGQQNYSKL